MYQNVLIKMNHLLISTFFTKKTEKVQNDNNKNLFGDTKKNSKAKIWAGRKTQGGKYRIWSHNFPRGKCQLWRRSERQRS